MGLTVDEEEAAPGHEVSCCEMEPEIVLGQYLYKVKAPL